MFLPDVVEVKPLGERRLFLRFADGLEGELDMDRVKRHYTGVFLPLLGSVVLPLRSARSRTGDHRLAERCRRRSRRALRSDLGEVARG